MADTHTRRAMKNDLSTGEWMMEHNLSLRSGEAGTSAAITDYGARYRSGRPIASSLAESAVGSLVARRIIKKQQM
jgi:hypothetical protein